MEPAAADGGSPRSMPRLLHILVCAASVTFIVALAVIVALRIRYPYELEVLEGWMVDTASQALEGRPLYGPPSLEFLSSVYNPVYFYVTAAFAWVMGVGFFAARSVSALSIAAILALLVFRLQPRDRSAGLVAAGLYAASYRFSGAWMDTARNDSLFLALLLGAFLIGRDAKSSWHGIVAGIAYALAFYTKQSALAVLAVLFAAQLFIDPRRYWVQWVAFAAITAGVFATLDWTTDGWYSYYTLDSALHFIPHPDRLYFLASARLKLLPGLLATMVLIGTLLIRRWSPLPNPGSEGRERIDAAIWSSSVFAIALVISSWAVFRQRLTAENTFMPACLGLAIGAGLAYGEFRRRDSRLESQGVNRDWQPIAYGAVAMLVLQQFAIYAYNPLWYLPRAADRAAGDQFVSRLRAMPGEVLVWAHGRLGEMAGKGRHAHEVAFMDAAGLASVPPRSEENGRRRRLVYDTIVGAVQRQQFDWIVIDQPADFWSPYYLQMETIPEPPREFSRRDTRVGQVLTRNPLVRGGRLDPADARWNFLFGTGWGPPGAAGRSLVGEDATVVVALESDRQYQLQAGVRVHCGNLTGKTTIFAWWNGKVVAVKTPAECGEDQLTATLTPGMIQPPLNRLRFSVVPEESEGGAVSLTSLNLVPGIQQPAVGSR